jgi:outer membrane protein
MIAQPAMGHEKGDWILRGGAIVVAPDESSDAIDVAGIVTLPGVDVDEETQIFGETSAAFRPFVGVGLNATIFFEEDVSSELNLALDGIVGLPAGTVDADLSLDDSYGLAAQVGFDYMINENWLINGTVWWMDIDTEAKVSTAIADVKFDVEIDPVVYLLSVGYRF